VNKLIQLPARVAKWVLVVSGMRPYAAVNTAMHSSRTCTPRRATLVGHRLHHTASDTNSYWQHGSQLLLRTGNICPQPRKLSRVEPPT
jgi:hypothetical protein